MSFQTYFICSISKESAISEIIELQNPVYAYQLSHYFSNLMALLTQMH